MTLEQFVEVVQVRIPTAPEMVQFAQTQHWRFDVTDQGAVIRANANDPLARSFAKMLSREPYRTNVLKALAAGRESQSPSPAPATAPELEEESAGHHCSTCRSTLYTTDPTEIRTLCLRPGCPMLR